MARGLKDDLPDGTSKETCGRLARRANHSIAGSFVVVGMSIRRIPYPIVIPGRVEDAKPESIATIGSITSSSLRGATRRSNPDYTTGEISGLLR